MHAHIRTREKERAHTHASGRALVMWGKEVRKRENDSAYALVHVHMRTNVCAYVCALVCAIVI